MRLNGSNIERTRSYNRRVVLEAVRLQGPISRAEIARLTSLAPQTVSNIAKELEETGLLRDDGRRRSKRGQPPRDLSMNPAGGYTVGIQLDHERLIGVLVNLTGEVIGREIQASTDPVPAAAMPVMAALVRRLITAGGISPSRILGVGVVMPGPFDVEGLTSVGPTTLPDWAGVDVAGDLSRLVRLPVFVENDATAAAIGERFHGTARGLQDFVYLFIGMGLGGGLVLGGQPYRGAWGNAGEVGHMIVEPGGRPCECGNRGCLERYVSLHAVFERLHQAGRVARSPSDIERLFAAGDAVLDNWLDEAAEKLRLALTTLENLFDPQSVLFGGYLPDAVLEALIVRLRELNPSVSSRRDRVGPRITRAAAGPDTTALGAAVLPLFDSISLDVRVLLKNGREPATTARAG